jgi:hypothetical protein
MMVKVEVRRCRVWRGCAGAYLLLCVCLHKVRPANVLVLAYVKHQLHADRGADYQ